MAVGQVNVTQENKGGGGVEGVERKVLFMGIGGTGALAEQLHALSANSDLDAILGEDDSELKTNIEAAILNAGQNFTGFVFPLLSTGGTYTWDTALEYVAERDDVEMVAITTPITSSNTVDEYQAACVGAIAQFAKYLTIHAATPGISSSESWADYLATTKALQSSKAADRVCLVPQLHGNNLGVVVGRLINTSFSIGDSPMKVANGPVVGLGPAPVDVNGIDLNMGHITALANDRFSVPQWYTGLDGIYWADHPTLDAAGGDFQVYENRRIIDYITRRVRIAAIRKIADRTLNRSDASVAYHQGVFADPLRVAAKGANINGEPKPGLIKPPKDSDLVINWVSSTEVEIYIQAAPLDSPKKISAFISLDLNREG